MFRDLKEYQEIQNLYENKVYLAEQEENELIDLIESFDLTDDEIEYFVENAEEFYQDEEVILLEAPFKALKTLKTIRSAGQFGGGIKTGINLTKSAKRANVKNILQKGARKPFDPIVKPKKFAGPVNFGKFTSIKDKLKRNAGTLALGAGLGAAAVGGGGQISKQVDQEKKKIEDKVKKKDQIKKITPVTTGGGGKSSGNAGGSTDSGGTAGPQKTETKTDTKPKTTETKTQTSTTTPETKTPETKTPETKTPETKTPETKTPETKQKKMSAIEKKNRARFGDERVDFLKKKNKDFQNMKKGGMTKDEFIKKYPKSITAQRAAGLRDHTEWDAYDLVLEYLHSSGQVATIEEANYVMTEMDAKTIQSIVEEQKKNLNEKFNIGKVRIIPALFKGGAAVVGTKMIASKLGQNSVTPVTPMNPVTPPSIEKEAQPGEAIPGRKPNETLTDYYKRRNKSTQQQIKNMP